MADNTFRYVIVGAGLAGASAVKGIREFDKNGSILLVGDEKHLPYNRPPLSKDLWFGKKTLEKTFVQKQDFYDTNGVTLLGSVKITAVDAGRKAIVDSAGKEYTFEKLLIATGGIPRRLSIPGGDLDGVVYYRYLDDYLWSRDRSAGGASAVVIGGGFIGSELAAALNHVKADVTMIFPGQYLVDRVFPSYLGGAIQEHYVERGIRIIAPDKPISFTKIGPGIVTTTQSGKRIESDFVIVGVGISPEVELARSAGLTLGDGIVVNDLLQTSNPDIYAAGDNAQFPYMALSRQTRVEHWDNALNQGLYAGRNMTGARDPYDYMPYFFSDLFEFGYEAVGEVSSSLDTYADWQKENDTGVIYYHKEWVIRGAMMCNVWNKVDAAREMIRKGERIAPEVLSGAIK